MKYRTTAAIIAVFLLVIAAIYDIRIFIGALAAMIILPVIYFFAKGKSTEETDEKPVEPVTIQQLIETYGQPDDSILTDATRGNEPDGVILFYDNKGFMIVNGEKINISDILSVTFNNTATPYTFGEYQILMTTKIKERQYIRLKVGSDSEWASDVSGLINAHLHCDKKNEKNA